MNQQPGVAQSAWTRDVNDGYLKSDWIQREISRGSCKLIDVDYVNSVFSVK